MLNSRAAIMSAQLIHWLPAVRDFEGFMSPRTRMVRGLLAILRACTRNKHMCCVAGLLGVLLHSTERIFVHDVGSTEKSKWDGTPLCSCIEYLVGHSLSRSDLHQWLRVITKILYHSMGSSFSAFTSSKTLQNKIYMKCTDYIALLSI
ncbi:WD-40 repeat family protein/beige-related [Abeliophyllum distichum]|uniref:WD-40 repeat family protein/beige-related n=1 Tax=Abeliophyllum distichum TaxID=126358 RepID=A0ABD1PLX5_9LAMI